MLQLASLPFVLLYFSSTVLSQHAVIQSQAQADATCVQARGPGYVAKMKADGSDWEDCITPIPPANICFGNAWTDPFTGASGCCPFNKPYSLDMNHKKGDCCLPGQSYSYDPTSQTGSCCSNSATYKCSCQNPTGQNSFGAAAQASPPPALSVSDSCPGLGTGGQRRTSGEMTWEFTCNKYISGTVTNRWNAGSLKNCVDTCAQQSATCKGAYYGFHGARAGECDFVGGGTGSLMADGINNDFVSAIRV